jgi:predicted  nucleic acid-binding Zn-ribbon protein
MSIHRLTARLQELQSMLAEQRKMAAAARAAMIECETLQARDDGIKARLTAARQRAEELRSKLDAVEPVRLEVWK